MLNDPNAQKAISTAAYGTSFGTAAGGAVSVNEMALWGGLVFAAMTFFVNWFYQSRKSSREAKTELLKQEILIKELSGINYGTDSNP